VAVPGVQAKLSLHLEHGEGRGADRLTLVGLEGEYILKPPTKEYPEMPELEHLCMLLAEMVGMDTAPCGLIHLADSKLAYITRRMDRTHTGALHMEDMCQLTDKLTEQKYRGSMEQVGKAVQAFSSNPGFDALRLFELTLFCFLTGNADMHLKNFSLLYEDDGMIRLSPAYDLLPTKLLMPDDKEELALTLNGKKNKLGRHDFDAFGKSMNLSDRQLKNSHERLRKKMSNGPALVKASFASKPLQAAFLNILEERSKRVWVG
jgi:serine/threonine-protein kinase HipA